jgi:hypothetical protein
MFDPSVVVHYLDIGRPNISPYKAKTPLIIDADAVLTLPVVLKRLQMVSGWRFHERKCLRGIKLGQLTLSNLDQSLEPARAPSFVQSLSVFALEGLDHPSIVLRLT